MQECGKQMGVLALNAAIEAGRLGESGKQFVTAAEDIRSYAANYDAVIEESRVQLKDSEKRIAELEEQMHHLISLLKENNIATARLMKSCSDVTRQADATGEIKLSGQLGGIVNELISLRTQTRRSLSRRNAIVCSLRTLKRNSMRSRRIRKKSIRW